MENREIAMTILEQLKACVVPSTANLRAIRGIQAMMCWGFQKPAIIEKGLTFKVSAAKLEGTVNITLDEGQDLYDIEFKNIRGRVVDTISGVFAEDLAAIIDAKVEV